MSQAPTHRHVQVAGGRCRLLEKGDGPPVGVLAGHNGLPRWTPFLDALARTRRVCLLSPPGFPGSDAQHDLLDNHLDWIAATLDLLDAAGLHGADLVAASVGGMLAWEVAAVRPEAVRRLSLTAPYGIFLTELPAQDYYAQPPAVQRRLLCLDDTAFDAAFAEPDEPEAAAEHEIVMYRAASAGARITWPFGDRGLRKRLHRVRAPVQLLWGARDELMPRGYAQHYIDALAPFAPANAPPELLIVPDSAHLAWLDQPERCAAAIEHFLDREH